MEIGDIIRELDEKIRITKKEIREKIIYIYCQRESEMAECPYCGVISGKIHRKYNREIADLPIAQYKVNLVVVVKKYTCANPECRHKRFSERLPFAAERSKRTNRLDEYIREIGLKNSSVEAAKLIRKTHVDISWKTILRLIKKSDKYHEV